MKKKLLFISTREFWKLNGGHQYEIFHYLRGLYEKYGYDIYVFTFQENKNEYVPNPPYFIKEIIYATPVSFFSILKNCFIHMFSVKNPWPIQNMLYFSKSNVKKIKEIVSKFSPSVIYVDMIRLAPYVEAFEEYPCLKVLGYDDLLSERYQKQYKTKDRHSNISGSYKGDLPVKILALQKYKLIQNLILRQEAIRISKAEIYYADLYDKGIFVSGLETEKFNKILGHQMAHTVMMGVDFKYYNTPVSYTPLPNSLSFVGNMKASANYETVCYIIENVLIHVKSNFQFLIYGAYPEDLPVKYKSIQIKFMGPVKDLRPAIKGTTIFLAPIAFGSGIKTKILEAFAMGMPVITNSVGIEGIDAHPGKDCIVADSPIEIAKHVDILLNNKELREMLSQNARKLAFEKYQWEKNWESFKQIGF